MTAVREYFESMTADDIRGFASNEREEDLHLEFKLVTESTLGRDDRKNFAKAVSGFANSDGGLIVWGVDARKNADGIDCASAAPGIADLKKLLSHLNEYTGVVVNPTLIGVEHRPIVSTPSANHGYILTFVPVSDSGPHMAKLGEDRYYRRSGSSFVKMEHFEIADISGRRPQPKLLLAWQIFPLRTLGGWKEMRIELRIENQGRGSARAPYLGIHPEDPFTISEWGLDGGGHTGLPQLVRSRALTMTGFGGSGDIFIHPGSVHPVTALVAKFQANSLPPSLKLEYEICAENLPLQRNSVEISAADLLHG
jgi:hypothetical protein